MHYTFFSQKTLKSVTRELQISLLKDLDFLEI